MRTHLSYGNKKDGLEMRGTISRIVMSELFLLTTFVIYFVD